MNLTNIDGDPTAIRRETEQAIENLIDVLDHIDALMADLEDDLDGEPGTWPEGHLGGPADRGQRHEDEEDDDTAEPTLGAPEPQTYGADYYEQRRRIFSSAMPQGTQLQWAAGSTKDGEFEQVNEDGGDVQDEPHDGMDEDGCEPSLGWSIPDADTVQGQGYLAAGSPLDLEGPVTVEATASLRRRA
jgi:hypothetical protein